MKILLEMVVTGEIAGIDTEDRITLIDSTIDTEQDAVRAVEAIDAFDTMLLSAGVFDNHKNSSEDKHLEINGDDFGYAEIKDWEDLVVFLGGSL